MPWFLFPSVCKEKVPSSVASADVMTVKGLGLWLVGVFLVVQLLSCPPLLPVIEYGQDPFSQYEEIRNLQFEETRVERKHGLGSATL
jgi:hypothetical protein